MKRRCSTCSFDWMELPSVTIGGGSGNYYVDCPIDSHDEVQYQITNLANFDTAHDASVVVSGVVAPQTPPTSTAVTVSGNNALPGIVYAVPFASQPSYTPSWEHVTNTSRRVFIRIDTTGTGQVSVSIKYRLHAHVMGRPHSVHIVNDPDHEELISQAQEQRVVDQLGYIKHPERVPI